MFVAQACLGLRSVALFVFSKAEFGSRLFQRCGSLPSPNRPIHCSPMFSSDSGLAISDAHGIDHEISF